MRIVGGGREGGQNSHIRDPGAELAVRWGYMAREPMPTGARHHASHPCICCGWRRRKLPGHCKCAKTSRSLSPRRPRNR
eukprot:529944-Pyramimonas_sp.AAC.1